MSLVKFMFCYFELSAHHRVLLSFPTRRFSDLGPASLGMDAAGPVASGFPRVGRQPGRRSAGGLGSDDPVADQTGERSEEHTSELQSRQYLVCHLQLEKKKNHESVKHTLTIQRI